MEKKWKTGGEKIDSSFPSVGRPGGRPAGRLRGGGLGAYCPGYGRRAGVTALAGAGRMNGHSRHAFCGVCAALGTSAATLYRRPRGQMDRRQTGASGPREFQSYLHNIAVEGGTNRLL